MIEAMRAVLGLLLEERQVWSIEELAREIGELSATLDAVGELARAGVVNRINERFVCASRAALCAERLSNERV